MTRFAPPSLLRTLFSFLLLGPLLLLWSFFIVGTVAQVDPAASANAASRGLPGAGPLVVGAILGAALWVVAAFSPLGFLYTVLPTAATAALYWALARRVARGPGPGLASRGRVIAVSAGLALLSASAVFALAALVEFALRRAGTTPVFGGWTFPIVAVDAALVGSIAGSFWRRRGG